MCEEWKSTFEIQNGKRSSEKSRNISFDIIRILAIFLVMYNHRETYIYILRMCHIWGDNTYLQCLDQYCVSADHRYFLWFQEH